MDIKRSINIKNEEDTKSFGINLGQKARAGQVIALIGDLGTGKTTLTKYIARGLGITENISSPTFTIVKEYETIRDMIKIENTRTEQLQACPLSF